MHIWDPECLAPLGLWPCKSTLASVPRSSKLEMWKENFVKNHPKWACNSNTMEDEEGS